MYNLVRYFIALTRLQAKPSEVPYSWPLLAAMVVINVVIEVSTFVTDWPLPTTTIIAMNIGSRTLVLFIFYVLLAFKSFKARWVQMSTAWLGVNAILGCAIFIVALLSLFIDVSKVNALTIALSFIELMLAFWLVWATAYILQFTLSVSKLLGMTLAIVIFCTGALMELRIAYRLSPDEMATIEAKATEALQSAQSKPVIRAKNGQPI